MSIDDNDSDAAELISHREFICGSDVTESDLDAAERGELIAWRRGPDGVQWFKRTAMAAAHPLIKAVPDDSDDDDVLDAGDGYSDVEPQLDDFERAVLRDWAEQLRQAAGDDDDEDDGRCE
jgi:hypothetical protein